MSDVKFQCQNCHAIVEENDMKDLTKIFCRVEPGDVMPYGECPHCGAACFPHSHYAVPYVTHRALAQKVLAVAVPGEVGDWAAYCDAVPGISHMNERWLTKLYGDKLPKDVAVVLFPQFNPATYRE